MTSVKKNSKLVDIQSDKIDIKKLIKEEGHIRKFAGIAPEGFILVHEKTLEDLRDFDIWKSWKNNETSIYELNKINFENN